MKSLVILVIVFVAGAGSGLLINHFAGRSTAGEKMTEAAEKKPLYWVAPMDKNYRRDEPGQSPMGMDLVPVYQESSGGPKNSVKIAAHIENNLGVKTGLVSKESLRLPIDTIGTVQLNEDQIMHIHSRVEGWIETLSVTTSGDQVKKGQVLYELYSPTLVNAQEDYLAALRSGNKNLIKASESRLLALGLAKTQIQFLFKVRKVNQRVKILAMHDGFVIDLNVRHGMHIKPSTQVMSIGNLDSIWVIGEVLERQSSWLKAGQSVALNIRAQAETEWLGQIDFIYPQLNPDSRTQPVRVLVNNPDHTLKPGMLANLSIATHASAPTLTIPRQALIKTGRHRRVVKALGDGSFQSVLVKAGLENNERVQILEGLNEGDNVVTSAHFLIDSESNIDADLARMDAEHLANKLASELAKKQREQQPGKRVKSIGEIVQVISAMGMLKVKHQPIPELDWPTMTMTFPIAGNINIEDFSAGQTISFTLWAGEDFNFMLEEIKVNTL